MSATPQHLAQNLKRMREARAWSQQQLADCSGVPRPTIANLESGDGNPTLNVMLRIASALGSSLEQLVTDAHFRLELRDVDSLPMKAIGQALSRQLHSDASGIDVDRLELPPKASCQFGPSRFGFQQVVSCEHGRVEVRAHGEAVKLKAGDVLRWRGQGGAVAENLGARVATLVVVTLPLPLGT